MTTLHNARILSLFLAIFLCLSFVCTASLAESGTYFLFDDLGSDVNAPTDNEPTDDQTTDVSGEAQTAEPTWNYPISQALLDDPVDVIRLVNKDNLLDSSYPPQDDAMYQLVNATVKKTKNDEMLVRAIVNEALERMFADAAADGANLLLHSAYRSYRTQAIMHENRVKRIGRDDGVVQSPGASDHQTGLGIDIINFAWTKEERLNARFAETKEAQWMAENCTRYGFIIRYPKGGEAITGITYEPWHLRYVGVEVATYITEQGLTLEEFTYEYRQHLADFAFGGPVEAVVDSFSF